MAAESTNTADETTTCPWCSASVPAAAATCPSCGASLQEAVEGDVLGVTQVDPAAISKAARMTPNRLTSLLGAERPADAPDLGGRIEAPSEEVRQEMLRLRLAAIDAELEAQKAQAAIRALEADAEGAARGADAEAGTEAGETVDEPAPEASAAERSDDAGASSEAKPD